MMSPSNNTAPAADPAQQAVDAAHVELWRRFIDPRWGILYDYAGQDGTVVLPTAAECQADKPNALGWWTPIENGAFFGGLYLEGLCRRWQQRQDARAAQDARTIAGGLLRLAAVGKTPGFIARGVTGDGESHYVAGSDDQTLPWFYGLWRYLRSGIPTPSEKEHVARELLRVGNALADAGWQMPCDRPGFGMRGSWREASFIHAARLLFVQRALYDISGDPRWLECYHASLAENPEQGSLSRLELCAQGAGYQPPEIPKGYPVNPPFWISASSQAALLALTEMEEDAAICARYRAGLDANARGAAAHLCLARRYDPNDARPFTVDWRFLNAWWQSQPHINAAVKVAEREVREWDRCSPRRGYEMQTVSEPLFAAWIVALSGNREILRQARDEIRQALCRYHWKTLYTSLFFMAECVYYQGIAYGL